MLEQGATFDEVRDRFRWRIPARYNIAVDTCDRWAETEPDRLALIHVEDGGAAREVTFGELRSLSNRFANLLAGNGVQRGDRLGVLLPQCPETAVAHLGGLKLGAITIPLFTLFADEALRHRLADSAARAIVTDAEGLAKLAPILPALPALELVLTVGGGPRNAGTRQERPRILALADALPACSDRFAAADTASDDPAFIIYTSGTTGAPKGALHAHRVLLGHLPGVEISHDLLPQPGDRIWTPADWAWIGGLLDVLFPALHHGVPVVARRFAKFTGEAAFALMREHGVRNTFLPPTALKLMRAAVPAPDPRWPLDLRTVASGGESLGAELIDWGRRVLGVTINEFYGQTECNMIVSSTARLMPPRPGLMGRPVPGHDVEVIDAAGKPCSDGVLGQIAVRRGDPVMFLGYWNNPAATAAKYLGDWLLTGDQGVREPDGFIRFVGREDDVITSAGYRIGPGEIEDCLLRHPAVRLACVVGKPDPQRTEIVKAYVVLNDGFVACDALAAELAAHVKTRLAAHEYPREVAFVSELPLTTTGKIIRRQMREIAKAEAAAAPQESA